MDPVFKDALVRLARVTLTAGIMYAVTAVLRVGVDGTSSTTLVQVVVTAFLTGATNALMEYLRTVAGGPTPAPVPGPATASAPSRAGAFQLRNKNIFDYFPI